VKDDTGLAVEAVNPMETDGLEWRRASTLDDALAVAEVRNSCREFMTHDQREIGREAQTKWWKSLDHERLRLFLLSVRGNPVGFGVVRSEENAWLTGGLLPDARGKGLGGGLFQSLCEEAAQLSYPEVWLDVFASNIRAVRLYERLGFERVSEQEGVIVMKKDLKKGDGP
jgi:ribosomal protein S18 acetylase RimI-like enzyme